MLRAIRESVDDHMLLISKALAFSAFIAIPSALLVAVGMFALVSGPATINEQVAKLDGHLPAQARDLLADSLRRLDEQPDASVFIAVAGFAFALWSLSSAMVNYMTALDIAYDRKDHRSFARRRLTGLLMAIALILAVALTIGILLVGRELGGVFVVLRWLVVPPVLLGAIATLLYLGPDVEQRSWRLATPGAVVAALVWLAVTGGLAFATARFNAYGEAWGSLSAVIVLLTWLWLASLALLFGAELDSELAGDTG